MSMIVLPLFFSAASAMAQAPESTIRESTDPAKVAEVERRAQELRSAQGQPGTGAASRMQDMTGGRGAMHGEEYGRHHRAGKRGHHGMMHRGHPKAAPGSSGPGKS